MNEDNDSKNLSVSIIFYTKYEIIKEEKFNIDTTFEKIINYYKNNIANEQNIIDNQNNFRINFKNLYKLNDSIIKKEDTLKSLISSVDINEVSEIKIWLELEEIEISSNNIINNLDEKMNIIYKPKSNPFSIFSFNTILGIVTLESYPQNVITLNELDKYNNSSAYCNSPNDLYISGGNIDNNYSKNFWIIDNSKKLITKKDMPFQKSNHSMIYLKEKYILITGGNNLKTFFYDINKNSFVTCNDINNNYSKPALFRYNNYIYCLSELNEVRTYFERLYINDDISLSSWEKIYPFFGSELDSEFNIKNFGLTSEIYEGYIILGGGDKVNNNTYLYDIENNVLSLSEGKNLNIYLDEKTFFRYENNINYFMNFSGDFEKKQEIVFFNQKNKSILLVDVDSIDGKIDINKIIENDKNIENEENNKNIGNISIRIIYNKNKNEKLKYEIIGEEIPPILDDIIDGINIKENENNKEESDLNNININEECIDEQNNIQNENNNNDENIVNNANISENENKNKEDNKKHKKSGLKKVTKAINGTFKKIFKQKKKDKEKEKEKEKEKDKENGNDEKIEDDKECNEEEEKEKENEIENIEENKPKKSLTNKYFGKFKNKFIKKRDSSSIDNKKNKKKDKNKEDSKKERNKSLHIKAKNIKKEE